MNDGGIKQLAADVADGTFRPTYTCPNGTACWAVFGTEGDRGVSTGRGPRRIVHCLTREIRGILPALVADAMRRCGAE